jgi:hypothetical protein
VAKFTVSFSRRTLLHGVNKDHEMAIQIFLTMLIIFAIEECGKVSAN